MSNTQTADALMGIFGMKRVMNTQSDQKAPKIELGFYWVKPDPKFKIGDRVWEVVRVTPDGVERLADSSLCSVSILVFAEEFHRLHNPDEVMI